MTDRGNDKEDTNTEAVGETADDNTETNEVVSNGDALADRGNDEEDTNTEAVVLETADDDTETTQVVSNGVALADRQDRGNDEEDSNTEADSDSEDMNIPLAC